MKSYFRLQIASVIGSAVDYLITFFLTRNLNLWYLYSNIAGNICGFVLQFILLKKWVFTDSEGKTPLQFGKYLLSFAGNLILSAAGIYLFTHFFHCHYLVSKTICSVLLGLTYNYWVQKRFVFA